MINMICFGGAAGCMVVVLWIISDFLPDGWNYLPVTALRHWLHRDAKGLARRIEWLEHCSRQWNDLHMQGHEVLWTEELGWIADEPRCRHKQIVTRCAVCTAPDACPCGYRTECPIWCGSGHETGRCAHRSDPYPEIEFISVAAEAIRPGMLVEKDAAGNVVICMPDEYPEIGFIDGAGRPIMWDVKGAGGKYER